MPLTSARHRETTTSGNSAPHRDELISSRFAPTCLSKRVSLCLFSVSSTDFASARWALALSKASALIYYGHKQERMLRRWSDRLSMANQKSGMCLFCMHNACDWTYNIYRSHKTKLMPATTAWAWNCPLIQKCRHRIHRLRNFLGQMRIQGPCRSQVAQRWIPFLRKCRIAWAMWKSGHASNACT